MAVEWNVYQGDFGSGTSYLEILYEVLVSGSVTDATTASATISAGAFSVVFEGDIILDGGMPSAGMINSLKIYDGDTLVAEASGYWLDIGVIGDTANELQLFAGIGPLFGLLNMQPVTFNGSDDDDLFIGGNFDDTFYGKGGDDIFSGGNGDDQIFGGIGSDSLYGGGGDDTIVGGKGADNLYGMQGNDFLTGGNGADTFHFVGPLGNGADQAGVDTITDFKAGVDTIGLDKFTFSAIGNKLNAGEFHIGGNAQDANDYILYKKSTGALFYDADGSGAGAKVKFAILANKPDLSHTDFDMIVL